MRLFLGFTVPESDEYHVVGRAVRAFHPAAKPARGLYHVTVRFFGDVAGPNEIIEAVDPVMKDVGSYPATVRGVGAFPEPHRARVVWAGVEAPGIDLLAKELQHATRRIGDPLEDRPFVAHITLARLDKAEDLRSFVTAHHDHPFVAGHLERLVLWHSDLQKTGPVYREVASWPLGASAVP